MEGILESLRASKKYGDVCTDTVERVARESAMRYKKPKDAEKAAREKLHGIMGAFMSADEMKRARAALMAGDTEAALKLHASTRERQPLDAFYDALFARAGTAGSVLDIACGMNPVFLGSNGISATGWDINGALMALINEWAGKFSAPVKCETRDALCVKDFDGIYDMALMMKLLPVLENQRAGAAADLISSVPARIIVATFPTRTLGGRKIGMENHYAKWFEAALPEGNEIAFDYVINDELVYILRKTRVT